MMMAKFIIGVGWWENLGWDGGRIYYIRGGMVGKFTVFRVGWWENLA